MGNPLNFALNTKAAQYVFDNAGKLGKFVLIPTTTTKMLKFTARGLTKLHSGVGVRTVGFSGRLDPWELICPKEEEEERKGASVTSEQFLSWRAEHARTTICEQDSFKGKEVFMADLVAFLICLTRIFDGDNFVFGEANLKLRKEECQVSLAPEEGEGMVLEKNDSGFIKAMLLERLDGSDDPVVVDDVVSMVEEAMKMAYIP